MFGGGQVICDEDEGDEEMDEDKEEERDRDTMRTQQQAHSSSAQHHHQAAFLGGNMRISSHLFFHEQRHCAFHRLPVHVHEEPMDMDYTPTPATASGPLLPSLPPPFPPQPPPPVAFGLRHYRRMMSQPYYYFHSHQPPHHHHHHLGIMESDILEHRPTSSSSVTSSSRTNTTIPLNLSSSSEFSGGGGRRQSSSDTSYISSPSPVLLRPLSRASSGSVSTFKSSSQQGQKICDVCGDVAKSLHFGGLSCDSCKAFFRRSVHNDAYLQFSCGYDQACIITKQSRKACQKCRFEKCLRIGMEKKWVMSEQERQELQRQRTDKKTMKMRLISEGKSETAATTAAITVPSASVSSSTPIMMGDGQSPSSSSSSMPPFPSSFSAKPMMYVPKIEEMLNYMSESEQKMIQDVCEYYRISYENIPYNVPKKVEGPRNSLQIIGMFTTILRRFAYFSLMIPEFRELSKEDQGNLLKASVLEMVMLRGALSFDVENNCWPNQNLKFLENCPQLKVEDMEHLTSSELHDRHMSFIKRVKKLKADEPTVMLLLMIVMFSGEMSEIKDPKVVQNISLAQEKYCDLLRKYVNWRYGPEDGKKLYPRFLTQLSDLRELNDLHTAYHLNLAEGEVNVIRQDLSQLKLDPYPKWKLFQEGGEQRVEKKAEQEEQQEQNKDNEEPEVQEVTPSGTPVEAQQQLPPLPQEHRPRTEEKETGRQGEVTPITSSSAVLRQVQFQQRRVHSRMREAFLQRIPRLIEDPLAPLMSSDDWNNLGIRLQQYQQEMVGATRGHPQDPSSHPVGNDKEENGGQEEGQGNSR